MFLDIVDLDENPDNSLVLAKLSDEVVKSAGKEGGGFGGKSYQGQFLFFFEVIIMLFSVFHGTETKATY